MKNKLICKKSITISTILIFVSPQACVAESTSTVKTISP